MATILTIILAYISTNVDNFFLLITLFSQDDSIIKKSDIIIGQYLGCALLILFSAMASFGLSFFSSQYLAWLGFIPIILGVKTYINSKKDKNQLKENSHKELQFIDKQLDNRNQISSFRQISTVVILTVSNGADNISVYIPLFTRYNLVEWGLIVIIFCLMIMLWCYLSSKMVAIPLIQEKLNKTSHIIVPIVFIVLGCFILTKNGLFF